METGLRLLMRDGAVLVLFRPKLTSEQYEELLMTVQEPKTIEELRTAIKTAASRWGNQVEFDM
jgi:hypothetical protein